MVQAPRENHIRERRVRQPKADSFSQTGMGGCLTGAPLVMT